MFQLVTTERVVFTKRCSRTKHATLLIFSHWKTDHKTHTPHAGTLPASTRRAESPDQRRTSERTTSRRALRRSSGSSSPAPCTPPPLGTSRCFVAGTPARGCSSRGAAFCRRRGTFRSTQRVKHKSKFGVTQRRGTWRLRCISSLTRARFGWGKCWWRISSCHNSRQSFHAKEF